MDPQLLQTEFLGNSIQDYCWFLGAIVVGLLFKKLISRYFSKLLYKLIGKKDSEIGVERFNELLSKPIGLFIMLSIIYLGASHIVYPPNWNLVEAKDFGIKMIVSKGYSFVYVLSVFWILLKVIDFVGLILFAKAEKTENKMDDQLIPFIIEIAKILTYVFGFSY